MRIGRVRGSVTATIKEPRLASSKLLVVDIEDGAGKVLEPAIVCVDTLGAGVGDIVLLVSGSAARIPSDFAGIAIDAATVAIVDEVTLA